LWDAALAGERASIGYCKSKSMAHSISDAFSQHTHNSLQSCLCDVCLSVQVITTAASCSQNQHFISILMKINHSARETSHPTLRFCSTQMMQQQQQQQQK
jgi:hypothetical protein